MRTQVPELLQRMLLREFLLEPELLAETGLEGLPARLATLLAVAEADAVARLTANELLEPLSLEQLQELLAIRDMALVSRTPAAVAAELKDPPVSYERCCRTALCYAVIGSSGHVFTALRAAAGKNDSWARHHYLYGLILGLEGNEERARWELDMALRIEPYEEGRARIRLAIDVVDGKHGGAR
jgi:hypothetical protein